MVTVLIALILSTSAWAAGTQDTTTATGTVAAGEYNESPMLTELVARGELPPVDERLPIEPAVLWPFAVDNPEIGKYGGTIQVFGPNNAPWCELCEETERGSYMTRTNDAGDILPDLIAGYTVSADEKIYTLHMREGMKWSNGDPFIPEDFIFHWKDMSLNEEVSSWFNDSEPLDRIEKTGEHTLRFVFKDPYPIFIFNTVSWRGGDWMRFTPSTYMKKWHIEHNPDANELAKEEGFDSWAEAFNSHWNVNPSTDLEKPMLQPWIFEEFTSTYRTFTRNPYYYAVDREANQLPYIDRIVSTIVDSEVLQLKIINGEAQIAFMNTTFGNYPLYKENEEAGGYQVNLIPGSTGAEVQYTPNQTHPDPVQREIYLDVRFRRALSSAINRDEINESVFFGIATPRQSTIPSAAVYYKPEWGEEHPYAKYDTRTANRLLDEVGLTDRDADGFRKRKDGQTMQLIIEYNSSVAPTHVTVHELVKEYWEDVGLRVLLKPTDQSLLSERAQAGLVDIQTGGGIEHEFKWWIVSPEAGWWQPKYNPYLKAELLIAEGKAELSDYPDGVLPGWEPTAEGRVWFDFQVEKFASEWRSDEYMEISTKQWDHFAEGVHQIGTVGMVPTPYVADKNIGNVNNEVFWSSAGLYESGNYLSNFLFFKE